MTTTPIRRRTTGAVVRGTIVGREASPPDRSIRWPSATPPPRRFRSGQPALTATTAAHLEQLGTTPDQLAAIRDVLADPDPRDGRGWRAEAACQRLDLALSDRMVDAETQVEVADLVEGYCLACPVARACLAAGVTMRASGLWGGLVLTSGSRTVAPLARGPRPLTIEHETTTRAVTASLADQPAPQTTDAPTSPAETSSSHGHGPARQRWQPRRLTKARRRRTHR